MRLLLLIAAAAAARSAAYEEVGAANTLNNAAVAAAAVVEIAAEYEAKLKAILTFLRDQTGAHTHELIEPLPAKNKVAVTSARIFHDYVDMGDRLKAKGIYSTFAFLGGAKLVDKQTWNAQMEELKATLESASPGSAAAAAAAAKIEMLQKKEWSCELYDKSEELAKRLMVWAQTDEAKQTIGAVVYNNTLNVNLNNNDGKITIPVDFSPAVVATGGGPGVMTAANRGAQSVPGARSLGMGLVPPFENKLNDYIDADLNFRFYYSSARKFWLLNHAVVFVLTPGGVGTVDEFFQVLSMKQDKQINQHIPIVLLGKKFWKNVINFDYWVEIGFLDPSVAKSLFITEDVVEAFYHIRNKLSSGLLLGDKFINTKI